MSKITEMIITFIAFIFVILMALFIPGIKTVFGIIGSTSANMIGFVLPGAFFIGACHLNEERARKHIPSV